MLPAKNNWFAAVLLLSACGCNLGPQHTAATGTDPFLNDSPKLAEIAPRYSQAGPASTNALHTEAVRPAWVSGAGSQAQPSDRAIVRTMAEVRMTDSVECPCPCPEGGPCPGTASEAYPDEYICDGGDRDLPIHYIDDGMKGLETEDTAVEFRDDEDKRHVRPTNRVCIYAPRFASISTISEPLEDVGGGRPRQAVNAQVGIGLGNREGVFAQHQREGTERLVTRERGSAVKADVVVEAVDQPAIPYTTAHTAVIAEEFSFLRTGLIKQADEVRLATSIASAIVWTRDQYPVLAAKSVQGIELKSKFKPDELVGSENKKNGKLRIVKLADKKVATSGEIVTFSIRYDNLGNREIHEVLITDNLTPRLEYIADSAVSDIPAQFEIEDNGEGSSILRWTLDEPLPGGRGGVVTFKALVR